MGGERFLQVSLLMLGLISVSCASEVILTGAEQLGSDGQFVRDIYPEVSVQDGMLSPIILTGDYARAYFSQALTDRHHIIFVARSRGAGTTSVELLMGGTNTSIANVTVYPDSLREYVVELDGMGGTAGYFDLRTVSDIGNPVAFIRYDVIKDPAINLYGASVDNVTSHGRYTSTSGNATTEGGNITQVDLNNSQLTDRWAAFYGNVVGSIVLAASGTSSPLYSWSWSPNNRSAVCLSTNSTLSSLSVVGANGSDIDSAWGLTPSASDSGTNTFNNTDCSITIGAATITDASYVDTGVAGGFRTCALRNSASPSKGEMLFCSQTIDGGASWSGGTADYEIMVPTPFGPAGTESYYFYANLN